MNVEGGVPQNLNKFFMKDYATNIEEYVVCDDLLIKGIIDASINVEGFITYGKWKLGENKINQLPFSGKDSGFEVEINTSQPKENKPIIYRYDFRIVPSKFEGWLRDHRNMMGGDIMAFRNKTGLFISIYKQSNMSCATIQIESKDGEHRFNLYDGFTIIAHREIINNHAWIVKCVVKA
jgi:hypothetical protein